MPALIEKPALETSVANPANRVQHFGFRASETPKTTTSQHSGVPTRRQNGLQPLPFNDIRSPGAYVACELGLLFRVPADALVPSGCAQIAVAAKRPVYVLRISENAWLSVTQARQLAADLDLPVNF